MVKLSRLPAQILRFPAKGGCTLGAFMYIIKVHGQKDHLAPLGEADLRVKEALCAFDQWH